MKNKPIIAIAVIIIILAVIVVARSHQSGTTTGDTTSNNNTDVKSQTIGADEALYTDPGNRFTFIYPKQFSVTGPKAGLSTSWREGATTTGNLLATLTIPKSYMPNTNFSDAKLTVGQSSNKTEIGSTGCPADFYMYDPANVTAVTINGQAFTKVISSDAAAGNRYDTTHYFTIRDGDCYAVEYTIHYGNIQNYDPSSGVKEFDETQVVNLLEKVVKSFDFTIKSE